MGLVWVTFLLRNIDPRLLRKLKKDAKKAKLSLSQFIRSLLCDHYDLDCPFAGGDSKLEFGARTQLLKLQPELFQAIKADSEESGISMRGLIMEVLETPYQEAVVD